MPRRIVTAREQWEMTAPWRQAMSDVYDEYAGHHQAPGPHSGFPIHQMEGNEDLGGVPDDWYTHPHYYTHGETSKPDMRRVQKLYNDVRGNPEAPVDIYRALPPGNNTINTGDWVTPSLEYAQQHARHPTDPKQDLPVIKMTVPAKHLWQNADSYYEMGYHGPTGQAKQAAAHPNSHPDLHESFATHGSVHTHGGRVLPGWRTAVADRATQESRLADPTGWNAHVAFPPLSSAVQGAQAYNSKLGLPDPHTIDYSKIRTDPSTVRTVGRHFDSLPNYDPNASKHYDAMAKEIGNQYDHLTNTMGVKVNSVDHDPYSDVHEMVNDVKNNGNLNVLGTRVTGSHPYLPDDVNDKFRAVHDFFGHAATGRSFDRHGEQAAYLAHAQMFSPHALPALASETKGQSSSLILNGHFGPQKMATMNPQHYWHDLSQVTNPRAARRIANMDPVTLYTKPNCQQCRLTKQRLDHHGIPHQIVDVTTDPAAYNHVTSTLGYTSAPVVDAGNGNHWSGFRPDRIQGLLG